MKKALVLTIGAAAVALIVWLRQPQDPYPEWHEESEDPEDDFN